MFGDEGDGDSGSGLEEVNPYGSVIIRAKAIRPKDALSGAGLSSGLSDGDGSSNGAIDDKGVMVVVETKELAEAMAKVEQVMKMEEDRGAVQLPVIHLQSKHLWTSITCARLFLGIRLEEWRSHHLHREIL